MIRSHLSVLHAGDPVNLCLLRVEPWSRSGIWSGCEGSGRLLAERQITLIYGGGHVGLMGLIADATLDTGGEGAPAHQKQITANAAKRKPPPVTTTFPAAGTAQACRAR